MNMMSLEVIILFIKHRPCWKCSFYSSTGMSDLKLHDLSPEKRIEE